MRANLSETRPRSTARLRRNRPGPRLAAGPARGGRPAEPAGNRALARLLGDGALQAKLEVDTPGDRWEREADRVADRIVAGGPAWGGPSADGEAGRQGARPGLQRMCAECREEEEEKVGGGGAPPTVQRKCAECEEESLQAKERPGRPPRSASPPGSAAAGAGSRALRVGGEPLPDATRSFFEGRFGRGFGDVRIHRGATAAGAAESLGARAFTVGRDIAFGAGEYAPGTVRGRHLLAHELTHVVQQSVSGRPRLARQTIDASCAGREDVLNAAWAEGVRLTSDTIDTLVSIEGMLTMPGGPLRFAPSRAAALRNFFGDVGNLEGTPEGSMGGVIYGQTDVGRILEKYRRIAAGFAAGKNLRCDPETVAANECDWRDAFVIVGNDDDIFLCPAFFEGGGGAERATERGATLLHEMAHIEVNADHTGLPERTMPPAFFDCGSSLGVSVDEALDNAFAYELFANCLHGTMRSAQVNVPSPAEAARSAVDDPRFSVSASAGYRLADDARQFAGLLGLRYSFRAGEMVVYNPVLGFQLLYTPASETDPAHLATAAILAGLRIQQPLRGAYFDLLGGGFVGFEAAPDEGAELVGGPAAALGGGWRWNRFELGAEVQGQLTFPSIDSSSVLFLGRGAVRF